MASRRKEFFPEVTDEQWNDWHWQVKNRIETLDQLKKYIRLTPDEEEGIRESLKTLRMAMVLATGAAVSGNIRELVRRTRYVCDLIDLEEVDEVLQERLDAIQQGVWAVGPEGECIDLKLPSVFMLEKSGTDLLQYGHRIFIAGAVSDKVFQFLRVQKQTVELIVRDFTRVFAAPESFYAFLRKGGRVQVLHRSRLLAVTINPQSPGGLLLDSLRLQQALEESLQIPVYDVKKIEKVGKNR